MAGHGTERSASQKQPLEPLLSITELSELLGVSVDTIYNWRHRGGGPPGIRVGRHVKWRPAEVRHWLDSLAEAERAMGA
jgi:excisionase family DNA binding protein